MTGMDLIRDQRGLLAKLARDLGVSRSAVVQWEKVPAERIPEIELSTGIPRHRLRPDICFRPCCRLNSPDTAA